MAKSAKKKTKLADRAKTTAVRPALLQNGGAPGEFKATQAPPISGKPNTK